MGEHVTVEHGHRVAIDAHGWVAQRVGDDLTELTASLHDWGRLQHLTHTSLDWITRAELWCQARGYDVGESGPVLHDHYPLSAPVTILLAVADDHSTIAIVSIDDQPPTVYHDITTDAGYWYQVDSLDIVCGCGRRWNWTGDELIDAGGTATTSPPCSATRRTHRSRPVPTGPPTSTTRPTRPAPLRESTRSSARTAGSAAASNWPLFLRGGSGSTRATSSGTRLGCGLVSEFVLAPPWALIKV